MNRRPDNFAGLRAGLGGAVLTVAAVHAVGFLILGTEFFRREYALSLSLRSNLGFQVASIITVIAVVVLIKVYNSVSAIHEQVEKAWSEILVQLKLRYDLVSSLVDAVKGNAKHEQETLERVVLARNTAQQAQTLKEQVQAEIQLTGAINRVYAIVERYPQLRAGTLFSELRAELSRIELSIANSRSQYNDRVSQYNTTLRRFPLGLAVQGMFDFELLPYFELTESEHLDFLRPQLPNF